MEVVIVILLELLFVYPGAFVRWFLFHRGKKTIKEIAADDWFKNSFIGILILGFSIGMIYTLASSNK